MFNLDLSVGFFYLNAVMRKSQELNKAKLFRRASRRQRVAAVIVFCAAAGPFVLFSLAATGTIDASRWIRPCGFKQQYGLPCPTCGMTTSTLAFVRGRIAHSFYTQPAAALLWCVVIVAAFLALPTVIHGVYFAFLDRLFLQVKVKYVFLALIVILAGGWAVTLARAFAAEGRF
jgi:hypothetical protein